MYTPAKTALLFFLISISMSSFSQTEFRIINVRDHRNNTLIAYRRVVISKLGVHINDGKYDLAVNNQLGVIGSDYDGSMQIGDSPAEGWGNKNIWFPIDGFKRTMAGKHIVFFSMDLGETDSDDDWNVRLEAPLTNPLIVANRQKLENEGERKYPINYINGEIDVHQTHKSKLMEYTDNAPKVALDHVGMYGPWVIDRGWRSGWISALVGNHGSYIEIHPMEQLWWTEKNTAGRLYHLCMFNDNSGRYNDLRSYDSGSDERLINVWQTNPMKHTYHIPFAIPLHGRPVVYDISKVSEKNLTTTTYSDGKEHRLVYNNKELLRIREPAGTDIMKISFLNVGIDPFEFLTNQDTLIKGFFQIETSIGNRGGDYAGNLMLKINETDPNISLGGSRRFRVTLQKMVCEGLDDGDDAEEIIGFIGVKTLSPSHYPDSANCLPQNSSTPILWSRLDGNGQKIRKDQEILLNRSFTYRLPAGSSITLIADLDEDDDNDGNKTTLDDASWYSFDDPDDKLERFGQYAEYKIETDDFPRGQSIVREFQFGSGGTVIKFYVRFQAL